MEPEAMTKPHAAVVRGAGESEAIWFRDNRMVIRARAEDTGGSYALVEAWARPGDSPPLHLHQREDEAMVLLSGRITVRCGEEEFEAVAGDFVLLPRGVPHTFRVDGTEELHSLIVLTPGGGEEFYVAAGRPAEGPGLPPATPPDIKAMVASGQRFGIELLGPPMRPQ